MFEARISTEPFDIGNEHARLARLGPHVGAIVTFTGQVRDGVLELETWPGAAERRMAALLAEARARWPIAGATIVHRHGRLEAGEPIVLVAVAAAHRAEAFEAAAFLMDWLKTAAPFWKKEADGTWVDAQERDIEAARAWDRR